MYLQTTMFIFFTLVVLHYSTVLLNIDYKLLSIKLLGGCVYFLYSC